MATWTHAHGASFEEAALVIEAREAKIASLTQQLANALKNSGDAGGAGGQDVAVEAIKSLSVALSTVGKG